MAAIVFDASLFRAQFPGQFPDPPNTDALIEVYWDAAICYVPAEDNRLLTDACHARVINLVTAHLMTQAGQITLGQQSGFIETAQIDKVSVTIQKIETKSELQWFLNQTVYGVQAYALLYKAAAGGVYFGGRNELGAFRRSKGEFTPAGPATTPATIDPTCPALTVAPGAPYDEDYGSITAATVTRSLLIQGDCARLTIEFDGIASGVATTLSVWSGATLDVGDRYNVYYWTGDDKAAFGAPTVSAIAQDITGATILDGLILASVTGTVGANPNLLVITGSVASVSEIINVGIGVA